MKKIEYKSGYKYQMASDYSIDVDAFPKDDISQSFLGLTKEGLLTIRYGYAWDGPSGPTIDTKTFMRGSLVHDALYQLLRMGLLPPEHRLTADQELRRICREDGMNRIRAWYAYHAVRLFAYDYSIAEGKKPVHTAP